MSIIEKPDKNATDGRRVSALYQSGNEVWADGPFHRDEEAYFFRYYCGDHDEIWVLIFKSGEEIARHNARNMDSIMWYPIEEEPKQ